MLCLDTGFSGHVVFSTRGCSSSELSGYMTMVMRPHFPSYTGYCHRTPILHPQAGIHLPSS